MIISKSSLNIAATILCKNEEDIIGNTIEHHINQGVKWFIVTDNNSTDRTKSIIEKYPEVVEIIDESGNDHRQSEWVTRMARKATKLSPDWIIHLDADEFWCGLSYLNRINSNTFGSTSMYMHPPVNCQFDLNKMKYYLDFDNMGLAGECKVGHRPDKEIVISHGNHGFLTETNTHFTTEIWRHHYPVRSFEQFERKATEGHTALARRGSVCKRWETWHNMQVEGRLKQTYVSICESWERMIEHPNRQDLLYLLDFWATPEVVQFFKDSKNLPRIGQWSWQLGLNCKLQNPL